MAFRNIEKPSTESRCRRGANSRSVNSRRMENSHWRSRCTVVGQRCFWGKDTYMKKIAIASCVGLMMVGALSAQEFSHFAFNIGGGFTQAVGNTGQRLDVGWNGRLGAGVNFSPRVGLLVNAQYDNMGVNPATLANIGVPGGRVSVFS